MTRDDRAHMAKLRDLIFRRDVMWVMSGISQILKAANDADQPVSLCADEDDLHREIDRENAGELRMVALLLDPTCRMGPSRPRSGTAHGPSPLTATRRDDPNRVTGESVRVDVMLKVLE